MMDMGGTVIFSVITLFYDGHGWNSYIFRNYLDMGLVKCVSPQPKGGETP